jgi:hypothetical protein
VKMVREAEEYQRSQEDFHRRQKEKQMNYREVLDDQRHSRQRRDELLGGMGDRERAINMELLKKVTDDPKMYSIVLHRARLANARSKAELKK